MNVNSTTEDQLQHLNRCELDARLAALGMLKDMVTDPTAGVSIDMQPKLLAADLILRATRLNDGA